MFENLFGIDIPLPARVFIAFLIVLALLSLTFWLVRKLGSSRLGTATRGRQPRLAIIDAANVDNKRRLILVRRDNVEHLMMIGGPTDIVVEQNIVRAVPVAPSREAPRIPGEAMPRDMDAPPRSEGRSDPTRSGASDLQWSPTPYSEPAPRPQRMPEPAPYNEPRDRPLPRAAEPPPYEPPPRAARPPEPRPPEMRPLPDSVTVATRQPRTRIQPEPQVEVRSPPTADVNLADMAQRLEAALRRPAPADIPGPPLSRSPAPPEPTKQDTAMRAAADQVRSPRPPGDGARARGAPPRTPEAPPLAPPADAATTAPPVSEMPPPVTTIETSPAAPPEAAKPPSADVPKAPAVDTVKTPPKSVFESLEEEMASLLGRPNGKP